MFTLRDKELAKVLKIDQGDPRDPNAEIILPPDQISNQRYLENVLLVKTILDPNGISWSQSSFCRDGEKKWYKMPLSPSLEEVTLLFNHPYENYEEVRKIPAKKED